MKKIFSLILLLCIIPHAVSAQADLQIVPGSLKVSPNVEYIGLPITLTMDIVNSGNSNATKSVTGIYISPTTNLSNAKLIANVSLEAINAGDTVKNVRFTRALPYGLNSGTNYITVALNDNEAIEETSYLNDFEYVTININTQARAWQNLPYPVIFIHGLKSSNETWDLFIDSIAKTQGWSFGGRMDFCLNQDADNSKALLQTDYKNYTNINNLHKDDFYTVNFDVDNYGTPHDIDVQSNQAAIVKQGKAVQDAIAHVLQVTGKDKVILVGHSMGGLAAREYLQNRTQSDGKHHVAKLLTIGTPHGGSNSTDFGLFPDYLVPDQASEAVRDLKTSYSFSAQPGAYLFNGAEDIAYMNDQFAYYNVDVNCNGVTGGYIAGLNNKTYPTDLAYSCIIGVDDPLSNDERNGDGVVKAESADITNYLSVDAEKFTIQKKSGVNTIWHLELTKQVADIVQGIDEPNSFKPAYTVSLDDVNYGTITYQSITSPARDYDYYRVVVPTAGKLNVEVFNIPTPVFSINIYNSSQTSVYGINSNGKGNMSTGIDVPAGTYYVVLSGIPTTRSWKYPYGFKLGHTPATVSESYCSGLVNVNHPNGTFNDGSNNNNYTNNSDCRWKIQPNGASSITLKFSSLNIDNSDTLYVYKGSTITSPLVLKCTGNTLPDSIISNGGVLLVRFLTDANNTSSGWTVNYSSSISPSYCNGTTTLTASSGTFSDGSNLENYINNANCSWLIAPQGAFSITLNFNNFTTESANDIVNVYDGSDNAAQLIGAYSGTNLPPSITSSTGTLYIEFITNSIETASGWEASYISYKPYNGSGIIGFEYWFDDKFSSRIYQSIGAKQAFNLNQEFSTDSLSIGLHTYNIRFQDDKGQWSSVASEFFHKLAPSKFGTTKIVAYEYWFDGRFNSKIYQSIAERDVLNLNQEFSTDSLTIGLHTYNVRFQDDKGQWSSITSEFFHKLPSSTFSIKKIVAYEYWFDDKNSSKVYQATAAQEVLNLTQEFSAEALSIGLHTYNIRFQDDKGQWSSVISEFFHKLPPSTFGTKKIVAYEYWFDNNYTSKFYQVTPNQETYILDAISINSLKEGLHTTHIRFKDNFEQWSIILTDTFTINKCTSSTAVITANRPTTFCEGNSVTLTSSEAATYLWSNGATTQSIVVSNSGNYSVTVTDSNGCSANSAVTAVKVNPLPVIIANATATTICAGTNVTLAGSGASTYSWTNGVQNGVAFTPTITATYTVTGTDVNNCTNSASATIIVTPLPMANFSASQTTGNCPLTVDFFDLSQTTGTTTYQWTIYNGTSSPVISSIQNPTGILFENQGKFLVKLQTTNTCGSDTKTVPNYITVNCPTGILSNNQNISFNIYPNPTDGLFTITGSSLPNGKYKLTISNVYGQRVSEEDILITNSAIQKQLEISQIASGIYFLTVSSEKTNLVYKINKQ